MYTFIDLFAGIGGIRTAFESSGCKCIFSSEWNKFSQKTYEANFGDCPYGDITKISPDDIPYHHILVGGFPCQPFSIAGISKKNSMGLESGFQDKTQGTLFFEIVKIVEKKHPSAIFLENVKNIIHHDKGRTFAVIIAALYDLGYDVQYEIINSAGYVPQQRKRTYIVAFRKDLNLKDVFEFPCFRDNGKKVKDILEKDVPSKYTLSDSLYNCLINHAARHKKNGNGFGFGLVNLNGYSRTLSARYYKDGSEILIPQDGKNPRRLTPRECANLMGFENTFKIAVSDTQAYKQFGNSVVVPLVTEIAKKMVECLHKASAPFSI
jgi:DNA (cytosine-5)-methyltransferase 1